VAKRCLFIPDYFNFLLSGRMVNELSIASHSQLIDVHGTGWSKEALGHFGIPRSWFAEAGSVAERLGPSRALPELEGVGSILVNGHDTASAFAAMPAASDGRDLYLSSGTWSLLGIEHDRPLLGAEALGSESQTSAWGTGDTGRSRAASASGSLSACSSTSSRARRRPPHGEPWSPRRLPVRPLVKC
jgi:rhamnulokinase